ncbi:MAG: WecB/TagA/CpsF family glycosyltransferase [Bacteroidales bacterium]|nr:WecB/TagA/CpsF family glycosyltransferase [Candidatus Sodaliphilus aphodohippi]
MNKVTLNGIEVFPFNSVDQLLEYVDGNKGILVAINAEKILHATDATRGIINRNIGYCDGVGAVMAIKQKGIKDVCKIAGCELWLKIIERYHKEKSFYLVGGKQDVIDQTIQKLKQDFPDINILGYRNGYFSGEDEMAATVDDIAERRPDVVFVAMGSPKQELFMEQMSARHKAIYQGLGGSFDVYTGKLKRAPKWWIDHKLEFAYRLIQEPKRIKRQVYYFKYLWWLITKKL